MIRMGRAERAVNRGRMKHWMRVARFAACLGLLVWAGVASGTPRQPKRDPRAFDLAVSGVDVRQLSSTSMFREVEIRCVVANRGPRASSAPATVVISRPTDEGIKVLKKVALPESIAPGETVEVHGATAAWFATPVTYRCEIQFGGQQAGDADPSDDAGEFTYPKQ